MKWADFLEQRADELIARANALGLQSLVPGNSAAGAEAQELATRAHRLRGVVADHSDLVMIVAGDERAEVPPRCRRCRSADPCEVAQKALADFRQHPDHNSTWTA
ncbi:hypothetical protein SAMN05660748_4501 [Blastococcus aggregatus]|uniref:Uncharacterized protein n=1 Tax=Blastococcus aggregatus TaxID=38502 RepID=A0A285VHI6_9ACTN|nr:hypothetical protein [Blastococcus aggregatus]SOC53574.1 hypothetical protein SAMN05660748_4501 [Blastococcus aggregatus]